MSDNSFLSGSLESTSAATPNEATGGAAPLPPKSTAADTAPSKHKPLAADTAPSKREPGAPVASARAPKTSVAVTPPLTPKTSVAVTPPVTRKTGIARLLELAMTRKLLIILACVLSILSVGLSFSPFIFVYFIIREIVLHYNNLASLDSYYLMQLGWFAAGGAAAAILVNFFALTCSHIAAFTTLYKLKLEFLKHIASLPLGFHTANASGKLRKIVDDNIEKLEGFIAHQLPDLVGSFAMPIFTFVILFVFDWRLGLACIVPIIITVVLYSYALSTPTAKSFLKKYQDSLEEMNNSAVEYVRGISVVKAFNQSVHTFHRFYETIRSYGAFVYEYTMSYKSYMVLFMVVINNVHLFLMPLIILLAAGTTDYATFALASIFYLIFSLALTGPFSKLLYVASQGNLIADNITRMDRILDIPPLLVTTSPKEASGFSINFNDVSFSYAAITPEEVGSTNNVGSPKNADSTNNAEVPAAKQSSSSQNPPDVFLDNIPSALNNISFTANQGEITALVGSSGSGKSTLAHLICRFYDVAKGSICIGGTDVRDMHPDYLMSIVSFVFQDVFLFHQSIEDNIRIGNPKATHEQIVAAAQAAQCHDFILALPHGYSTMVGSDGAHLSGGERQRIVIARAILKDAPILVLDEATAFADPENEHRIQMAFEQLMKGKTVIVIAHRLATIRGADKIAVLDAGHIVENGTHDELLGLCGHYAQMWSEYNRALGWSLGASSRAEHSPDASHTATTAADAAVFSTE
ncbi:MAG: ATP-binding cassette domain-containing protein [Coriobacteriales bacterium]|jgi:ATP-binding cassette subfamily B protein|nr:ATP-binding cassette domain-containing protein [Coriobacteriales bacterium]